MGETQNFSASARNFSTFRGILFELFLIYKYFLFILQFVLQKNFSIRKRETDCNQET